MSVFFCQAEDGIRDLVRSRGLGDVYKRQATSSPRRPVTSRSSGWPREPQVGSSGVHRRTRGVVGDRRDPQRPDRHPAAVSYTHLTLPTSDLV